MNDEPRVWRGPSIRDVFPGGAVIDDPHADAERAFLEAVWELES